MARLAAAALLGGALAAGGCSWRSPTVEYYALSPMVAPDASAGLHKGPALAVGPATFPRFLLRPQIVTRSGENKLVYDEYHRWGGGLEAEFLDVLAENLGMLLDTHRVAVYPTTAAFPVKYRVQLDVQQFDGRPAEAVTLRALWTITPGGGGDALLVEQSNVQAPIASERHEDLVTAYSQAIASLAREIAAGLESLAESPVAE